MLGEGTDHTPRYWTNMAHTVQTSTEVYKTERKQLVKPRNPLFSKGATRCFNSSFVPDLLIRPRLISGHSGIRYQSEDHLEIS